jgi:hypothetical protein
MTSAAEAIAKQRLIPLALPPRAAPPGSRERSVRTDQSAWRIVRYVEEPQELADLNRWWRHPTNGKPELIRYAVEVDGERKVWGLKTRAAAARWLARLTAPVQLVVPELGDGS